MHNMLPIINNYFWSVKLVLGADDVEYLAPERSWTNMTQSLWLALEGLVCPCKGAVDAVANRSTTNG